MVANIPGVMRGAGGYSKGRWVPGDMEERPNAVNSISDGYRTPVHDSDRWIY